MDDPLSIKILISRRNKSPCLRVCSSSGRDWCSSVVGPSGLVTCSKKKKSVCPHACMSPCFGPHDSEGDRTTTMNLLKKWENGKHVAFSDLKESWNPVEHLVIGLWWPWSGEGRVVCSVSRDRTSWAHWHSCKSEIPSDLSASQREMS